MTNKTSELFTKYLEEKLGLNTQVAKECQFQQRGIYVREDDQDWGGSGMQDILNNNEETSNA